jgi:hypothetical protein
MVTSTLPDHPYCVRCQTKLAEPRVQQFVAWIVAESGVDGVDLIRRYINDFHARGHRGPDPTW